MGITALPVKQAYLSHSTETAQRKEPIAQAKLGRNLKIAKKVR